MTTPPPGPTQQFLLPDLGEGLTEAELVGWRVQVGDVVHLNQTICEVETAKALVELPSPFAGTVTALLVYEGQTAQVGHVLIEISAEPEGAGPASVESDNAGPPSVGAGPDQAGILVGTGPLAHRPSRLHRATFSPHLAARARRDAKPAARQLARELGVDLAGVDGSGPGGVITADDVRAVGGDDNRETRRPVHGVRRAMADAVTLSARTIPQVTEFLTVDVTASMDMLRELQQTEANEDYQGLKLTPLTLVAYALVAAVRDHPELNSSWDEESQEVIEKHYVNLGIAVASPRGLIVPNIKDADQLRLSGLARAIEQLTDSARASSTSPADLVGGTISITNVGVFGVDTGTPLLNPGEAAILCLGAVAKRPWVHRDELAIRELTTLGLTFDHRLADGEQASRFLARLGSGLANPLRLFG